MAVTVGSITVIITDYKLLKPENSPSVTPDRNSPGPTSEDNADNPGPSYGTEHSNGVSYQEDSSWQLFLGHLLLGVFYKFLGAVYM